MINAIAISAMLTMFLMGFFLLVTRHFALSKIIALLLMENAALLGSLIISPNAGLFVALIVLFDLFIAVFSFYCLSGYLMEQWGHTDNRYYKKVNRVIMAIGILIIILLAAPCFVVAIALLTRSGKISSALNWLCSVVCFIASLLLVIVNAIHVGEHVLFYQLILVDPLASWVLLCTCTVYGLSVNVLYWVILAITS